MPIDELGARLDEKTWKERVAERKPLVPIDLTTQYLGNRVRRTFYPEHWAQVQIARDNARRYGQE